MAYRAGFATTQLWPYEEAFDGVLAMLDTLEGTVENGGPFLRAKAQTEADIM